MDQGFAPTTGLKAARNAHTPTSPVLGARGALYTKPVTSQDKAIAAAEGVRSAASLPFTLMLPGMGLGLLGGAAGMLKRNRTQAALGGTGKALLDGVRVTKLDKALETPANMLGLIAEKSAEVGGRAEKWVAPLTERSNSLRSGVQGAQASIGKFIEKLPAPVSKALGKVGKLPVGAGIAAVAATAGISVVLMKRNKLGKEHAATLSDMRSTFGDNHPLVTEASKRYTKEQSRGIVSATLECANEASMVVFESVTSAGMGTFAALMAGSMGLQSAQQMFVVENPTADAFAGLKAAEKGTEVQMAQKAFWFQTLLGNLPEVQAKGGTRNHLAAAMGKELAEKKTTVADFSALVNDPAKFTAFVSSVSEKFEAAKAAKAAASAAKPATAHAATAAHAPATHLAAAPATKVTAVHHDGQLQAHQLAR